MDPESDSKLQIQKNNHDMSVYTDYASLLFRRHLMYFMYFPMFIKIIINVICE